MEACTAHALDASGGSIATAFDKFVASVQKDEAFILKQQRLAKEEGTSSDNRERRQSNKEKAKADKDKKAKAEKEKSAGA